MGSCLYCENLINRDERLTDSTLKERKCARRTQNRSGKPHRTKIWLAPDTSGTYFTWFKPGGKLIRRSHIGQAIAGISVTGNTAMIVVRRAVPDNLALMAPAEREPAFRRTLCLP